MDLTANDTDSDGPSLLAITRVTDGSFGTVVDTDVGTVVVTVTHDGSETTTDSFTYTPPSP